MNSWKHFISLIIKKILPGLAVVIICFGLIYYFRLAINQIAAKIDEQQNTAFVLENRNITLTKLKNDFAKIGQVEQKIASVMPPVDDIQEFSTALDSVAVRGALTQAVNFSSPVDENSVDFSVLLNANIFSLIKYLQDFEALPFVAGIDAINIQAQAANWEGDGNVNLGGIIFTKPTQ
jgi:hypothetical protein